MSAWAARYMGLTLGGLLAVQLAAPAQAVRGQYQFDAPAATRQGGAAASESTQSTQSTQSTRQENWWVYLRNDKVVEFKALLATGMDPNLRTAQGQPAIMHAVEHNAWQVFDALVLDKRINLNIENAAGETPLMYLAVAGQTARAKALIRRGAQVNRLGWTALHYAAARGHVGTAQLLLAAGAMPNAPSPQGRTPLMMAAYAGSSELVQLLLAREADPTTRDLAGRDAADWAQAQGQHALAEELRRVITERLRLRERWRKERPPPAPEPAPSPVQVLPVR